MKMVLERPTELLSRILNYPGNSIHDESIEGRVRAEQINNIKRYLTWVLLANICNALVLVAALWTSPFRRYAIIWAAGIIVIGVYFGLRQRRTATEKPSQVSAHTIIRAIRNALLLGSMWATLPLIFFANLHPAVR